MRVVDSGKTADKETLRDTTVQGLSPAIGRSAPVLSVDPVETAGLQGRFWRVLRR